MKRENTIGDLSAVVTGILIAFNVPVGVSPFIVIFGGIVAIVVVKQMFGGIGQNFVNPALTARIILMCVKACPKHLITFVPATKQAVVRCSNCDKGALTNKVCKIGCIGCMKCEKTCQYDAVHVVNSLASVDPSKCIGCGECVDVCPRHCITMFNPEI